MQYIVIKVLLKPDQLRNILISTLLKVSANNSLEKIVDFYVDSPFVETVW